MLELQLHGDWVFANLGRLQKELDATGLAEERRVNFVCGDLQSLDLAAAWILYERSMDYEELGLETAFSGFRDSHFKFLQHIIDIAAQKEYIHDLGAHKPAGFWRSGMEKVGRNTIEAVESVGYIAGAVLDGVKRPSRLVIGETIRQVHACGGKAIPIVGMVCFLMGIVLAYQSARQLEQFGANIYMVDLVANSILRELGVLLAAIMVAGRSGSAFAAALGTMKLNEEVDALRVMGLNPNQILIIPRVLGLMIALPFLTVYADAAGLLGGAFIGAIALDINWLMFTERLLLVIDLDDVLVGLSKAPAFAFLIAVTGTLRGMQVEGSAEELGRLTTMAVVQSIFLIIVADAIFTVVYARIGF
ncbi:MAG: ABC transporter permease [Xanthomonadales bacterium]|nr:ABC transporter permease [Xanthomonadales bacterium]